MVTVSWESYSGVGKWSFDLNINGIRMPGSSSAIDSLWLSGASDSVLQCFAFLVCRRTGVEVGGGGMILSPFLLQNARFSHFLVTG